MTHQSHEQSIRPDHKPSRGSQSKLAVPEGSVEALEALLRTTDAGHVARRHEVTTYFDTERRGISLRVRVADGQCIQTVKADRRDSLAADRTEWEWPIKQNKPDLRAAGPYPRWSADLARNWATRRGVSRVQREDTD